MSRETVERLTAAMNANKIKYNKEFATALQRGFPDEARAALFEEITGDMDSLIRRGVNSDFSKDMKKTLEHLSDIAVKLGEENRRSLTYERLRVEKRECLANMKVGREPRPSFDMCENVRDYLESAKEGMRIMQPSTFPASEKEKLPRALSKDTTVKAFSLKMLLTHAFPMLLKQQ